MCDGCYIPPEKTQLRCSEQRERRAVQASTSCRSRRAILSSATSFVSNFRPTGLFRDWVCSTVPVVESVRRRRLTDLEVAALVKRAQSSDQDAWNELVDTFGGLIWTITRSLGLNSADAIDVSQVTWLRLVEHLDKLTEPGRLAAWLATTTRRECIRVLRISDGYVPVADSRDLEPDGSVQIPLDAAILADEQAAAIVTAFGGLTKPCQRLLRLVTADPPLSYRQVSEMLSMPIGSIGPTRQRCLDCLRRLLDQAEREVAPYGAAEAAS